MSRVMGEEVEKLVAELSDLSALEPGWYANVGAKTGERCCKAMRQAVAALQRLQGDLDTEKAVVEHWKVLYGSARADKAAAEAQVEAMRKALEEADSIFRREGYTTTDHPRPMIYAARSAPAEERSLGPSSAESAARRPSDVCDQTLHAALEPFGRLAAEIEPMLLDGNSNHLVSGMRQPEFITGDQLRAAARALASSTPEGGR